MKGITLSEVRLKHSARMQSLAGFKGGGPRCPWCGQRALHSLPCDDRRQCGECYRGATVRVENGALVVKRAQLPRRKKVVEA